jgi:hypothetical protein
MRLLTRQADLRALRNASIAAGINDVRSLDAAVDLPATVHSIVRTLAENAYDSRIPRLVAQYFMDMAIAFSCFRVHLRPSAPLIVDIGDSRYGGVHVATDELLVDVLAGLGYVCESRVTIRERRSRDGSPLRQSLLVLRLEPKDLVPPTRTSLPGQWIKFRTDMPHRRLPMSKRNWGGPLHSLCSYGGKLKPAIAANLVAAFVPKGGRVLDPFAGAGTIPYEAALQGSTAFGFDLSPTAWHITRAKLDPPSEQECMQVIAELEALLECDEALDGGAVPSVPDVRFNGGLDEYYHPRTLREIVAARSYFLSQQPPTAAHSFVLASLLHILHGNRPYALSRRSHPITPFAPSGDFEYRALIPRLTAKVRRSIDGLSPDQVRGEAYLRDAAQPWPAAVERLDAVVTSPPFFDSTRFYLSNWIRMWFTGWDARDFSVRPGNFVEVRQRRSFEVYQPIFRQARERLKPGGFVVLHLGASRKCDMVSELSKVAAPWFRVADTFVEDVSDIEHHGIRDKGTVTAHQYLVLD